MCHPWKLVKYMLIASAGKAEEKRGYQWRYMTVFFHQYKMRES